MNHIDSDLYIQPILVTQPFEKSRPRYWFITHILGKYVVRIGTPLGESLITVCITLYFTSCTWSQTQNTGNKTEAYYLCDNKLGLTLKINKLILLSDAACKALSVVMSRTWCHRPNCLQLNSDVNIGSRDAHEASRSTCNSELQCLTSDAY